MREPAGKTRLRTPGCVAGAGWPVTLAPAPRRKESVLPPVPAPSRRRALTALPGAAMAMEARLVRVHVKDLANDEVRWRFPSITLTVEEEPPEVPLSSRALPVLSPAGLISSRRMAAGRTVSLSPSSPPPLARRSRGNPQTRAFRKTFFPDATDQQWNDWRWQSRNRIRTLAQLEYMLVLSDQEREALLDGGSMLPMGITPYYMSLHFPRRSPAAAAADRHSHRARDSSRTAGEADDPLGEDQHSPVPGLVHRYPDRVLLLVLDFCSTYCRYCTRSRVVGHGEIAAQRGPAGEGPRVHPADARRSATSCSPAATRWP